MKTQHTIKKSTFSSELEMLKNKEGIVLMGCGGDLSEWVDGVSEILVKEQISGGFEKSFEPECIQLSTTDGRIDLIMIFKKDTDLKIGKLAMWRLRFGECSWLSDYIVNYARHHTTAEIEKPKCELIGGDGNVFAIIAKVCNALRAAGLKDREKEFQDKAFKSSSYNEVLVLCHDYVEVI